MQGASVKQTRSVCSPRARAPAGGRSRCGFAKQIRGFSAQCPSPISMRCLSNLSRPCTASMESQARGESNSMQGASVKQTRSVRSERARAAAAGRSRCGFAKQIRGFSAQRPSQISMRCRSGVLPRPQPINGFPKPRRIELCAGRGRKENATATQGGTRFPTGGPGGKFIPESALRTGRAFPMTVQAESSSRNPASNWDALSAPSPQLQNLCALHSKTG